MMLARGMALAAACFAVAGAAEPIRVHPANPHYLLWQGRPFLVVTSGEHYGAVLNGDFDWRRYLDTLAREGMNYTRLFTGAYRETPGDFGIERNTLAPLRFVAPWAELGGKFDLGRWNPAYFERLKAFVSEAERLGIAVEVTLFCSTFGEKQWSVSPFHPANNRNATSVTDWKLLHTLQNGNALPIQEALVRKIVRELNPYSNVIFEIQNEPWADRTVTGEPINPYAPRRWPNTADCADESSLAWQERVAEWIRSEESGLRNRHLIAWNACNFRAPLRSILKGADIVNFHYAYPEAVWWNYEWNIPVSYDETGFLGTGDEAYRRQAWRFLLAGGGLFNHLDYSFSVGREDGTDRQSNSPGGGSPALRRQLRLLRDWMEKLPYLAMKPAPELVRHSPGAETVALQRPGDVYAVYFSGTGGSYVLMDVPAGTYRAEWMRPEDGSILAEARVHHGGGALRLATPAFDVDAALRLERVNAR
ncbi:MAG: hypothetical protein ACUVS7_14215 [Bryobacteraceae bacterium]